MVFTNGTALKNILIIHGWMHSADRYTKLAKSIPNCRVTTIDLPGFGNYSYKDEVEEVVGAHVVFIHNILISEKYDFVIAHSLGGMVLLRTVPLLPAERKPDIILLNPIYGVNNRLRKMVMIKAIPEWFLTIQSRLPFWAVKVPTKVTALLTINKWSMIDDKIVRDAQRANPKVAFYLLMQMAVGNWRVTDKSEYKKSYLIYSDRDRIIGADNMKSLSQDLQPEMFHVFHGVGHTLVVERFDELAVLLKNIIWEL